MKSSPSKMNGRLTTHLFFYIAALLLAHWITVLLTQNAYSGDWALWFDLDREYNVPTVSNTVLLASSGLISLRIAIKSSKYIHKIGWALFAALFIYLSLDEILMIHEQFAEPVRKLLNIGNANPLYHAWVVPAIFVIITLLIIWFVIKRYHKDLLTFTPVLKYIVLLSAGVVSLEIIGTFVYDSTVTYRLIMVPLEEIFELSMAVLILKQVHQQLKSE